MLYLGHGSFQKFMVLERQDLPYQVCKKAVFLDTSNFSFPQRAQLGEQLKEELQKVEPRLDLLTA